MVPSSFVVAPGPPAGVGSDVLDSIRVTSPPGPIADSLLSGCHAYVRGPSRQTTGESASTTSIPAKPSRAARARKSRLVLTPTGVPVYPERERTSSEIEPRLVSLART